MSTKFDEVEDAISAIGSGQLVVVVDDDDRRLGQSVDVLLGHRPRRRPFGVECRDVLVLGQHDDVESEPLGDLPHFVIELLARVLDLLLPSGHQFSGLDLAGIDHRDRSHQAGDGDRDPGDGQDEVEEAVRDFLDDQPRDFHRVELRGNPLAGW